MQSALGHSVVLDVYSTEWPTTHKVQSNTYVKSWLVKHRGAMNSRTRPCKAGPDVEDKEALWVLL